MLKSLSMDVSARRGLLALALAAATVSAGACNRGAQETVPVAELQSQTPTQEVNAPVNLTGCLMAGDAQGTFVLTTSEAQEQGRTATYALNYPAGLQPEDLREHVGRQVAVQGVVQTQQGVTAHTPGAPAASDAVGTAGQPTVATTTELAVRHLQVETLRPLDQACEVTR